MSSQLQTTLAEWPQLGEPKQQGELLEGQVSYGLAANLATNQDTSWADVVHLKQVHGVDVEEVSRLTDQGKEGDGLITPQSGLRLGIKTADCVPILLATRNGRGTPLVAGIHAGWRGLAQGIIPLLLQNLSQRGCQLSQTEVVIGPHVCASHYEVGIEVLEAMTHPKAGLADWQLAIATCRGPKNKWHFDPGAVALSQLCNGGIKSSNIQRSLICTVENSAWASYRRDGRTGTSNLAWIEIK